MRGTDQNKDQAHGHKASGNTERGSEPCTKACALSNETMTRLCNGSQFPRSPGPALPQRAREAPLGAAARPSLRVVEMIKPVRRTKDAEKEGLLTSLIDEFRSVVTAVSPPLQLRSRQYRRRRQLRLRHRLQHRLRRSPYLYSDSPRRGTRRATGRTCTS